MNAHGLPALNVRAALDAEQLQQALEQHTAWHEARTQRPDAVLTHCQGLLLRYARCA